MLLKNYFLYISIRLKYKKVISLKLYFKYKCCQKKLNINNMRGKGRCIKYNSNRIRDKVNNKTIISILSVNEDEIV